jgi:large subunit ribosomal protein L32
MGLPAKQRTSRSKHDRASHFALKAKESGKCEKCDATTIPHRACPKCGNYHGHQAVKVEKRTARAARRKKIVGTK